MKRLLVGLAILGLTFASAWAEGLSRRPSAAPATPSIALPWDQQPMRDAWKPAFEMGLLGGYAFSEEEKTDLEDFAYGLYAGVNVRSGMYGFGIEADAMRFAAEGDLADWLVSLRGRGGFYVTDNIMAYGTAGWAIETDQAENGWVAGLGLQMETGRVVTRIEWLHYDLDTDVQMVRAGLGVKF